MHDTDLFAIRDLAWAPPDGGERLFDGIDFSVASGESLGLSGPSGSGKSTLLRCVVGLEPRQSGEVFWRGDRVTGDRFRQLRRRVVYVHQEPLDIAGTLGDNMAFAREMAADADVEPLDPHDQRALLEELGLGALDWSRRFGDLSVGERQRAALVRCLTLQPAALLLDEPTASLDERSIDVVEDLLEDYVDGGSGERSLVWVSHDTDQLERVTDRIVDIRDLSKGG